MINQKLVQQDLSRKGRVSFANPKLEKMGTYYKDIIRRLDSLMGDYRLTVGWHMTDEETRALTPEMREVFGLVELLKKALEKSGKKITEVARRN